MRIARNGQHNENRAKSDISPMEGRDDSNDVKNEEDGGEEEKRTGVKGILAPSSV